MSLMELQDAYGSQYSALTPEEREEVVKEFVDEQDNTLHIRRPSPRSQIADVSHTVRNMRLLVSYLNPLH